MCSACVFTVADLIGVGTAAGLASMTCGALPAGLASMTCGALPAGAGVTGYRVRLQAIEEKTSRMSGVYFICDLRKTENRKFGACNPSHF